MDRDLARSYRGCARTTRRAARNFYVAFLTLPRVQRCAVYALYAFCREADSVADSAVLSTSATSENGNADPALDDPQSAPSTEESGIPTSLTMRRGRIEVMRARLTAAAAGRPIADCDRALADAIARFGILEADLQDVLAGIEMDFGPVRIATVDELVTYCHRVASAVGLATLPVLADGVPPTDAMRAAAADLGLGLQYVNILRDVGEDLTLGRVYLPATELSAHGLCESDLAARAMTDSLRSLLAAHATRACEHLERGRRLLADLPPRGRACPWLLAEIYGRILARIVAAGYPVFERRIGLPTAEKLWLLATAARRSR